MAKKPDFPWPKKGNKLFREGSDTTCFVPSCILFSYQSHPAIFKDAADRLLASYFEGRGHQDELLISIAYNYRHAIELMLKELVIMGIGLRFYTFEDVREILHGHLLMPIWNKAKIAIVDRFGDDDLLGYAESMVNELHQADRNGQRLRYVRKLGGKRKSDGGSKRRGGIERYDHLPQSIDIENMKESMDALYNFLSCTHDGLEESYSSRPREEE